MFQLTIFGSVHDRWLCCFCGVTEQPASQRPGSREGRLALIFFHLGVPHGMVVPVLRMGIFPQQTLSGDAPQVHPECILLASKAPLNSIKLTNQG